MITEISDSPSWIPDLTAEPSEAPLTLRSDSFATSGSSSASIRFGPNSHLLRCKGFIADRIDGMGCMWSKAWAPQSVLQTQGTVDPYNTFVKAQDAIWKSMVACHSLPSEYLDADYGSLLATPALAKTDMPDGSPLKDLVRSFVSDWCVEFLKGNAKFKVAGRCMEEYYWKETQPQHIDAVHLRNALMQRDRINLSRRLVTTERGYVGMALETVERGDAVGVLYGCSMPIVLRESKTNVGESRWRVIGECYLHGMMNGEAMEWGTNTQDIVLF